MEVKRALLLPPFELGIEAGSVTSIGSGASVKRLARRDLPREFCYSSARFWFTIAMEMSV